MLSKRVSLILPTYIEAEKIPRLAESIKISSLKGGNNEILVVD